MDLGQIGSEFGRLVRQRGTIGRHEDFLEHQSLLEKNRCGHLNQPEHQVQPWQRQQNTCQPMENAETG